MDFPVLLQPCSPSPASPGTQQSASKAFVSRGKLLCARKMENGSKRDQAPCVPQSRVLSVWYKLRFTSQLGHPEASKAHVAGIKPLHQSCQFMKVSQCKCSTLQPPRESCLRCDRSQLTSLFQWAPDILANLDRLQKELLQAIQQVTCSKCLVVTMEDPLLKHQWWELPIDLVAFG